MKRWLVLIGCVVAAVACDPLLPLRVKDEVQPVSELQLLVDSASVRSGMTLDVELNALDGGDNEINLSSKEITFTVTDADVLSITKLDANTLRVSGKKVGQSTVTVEIDDVVATRQITVNPGLAGKIELLSGGGQLGVANDPLLQPLVFVVKDGHDNLVPNANVAFQATSGSVAPLASTNSAGQCTLTYTPTAVGSQSVTASISGNSSIQVVVPVTVTTLQPVLSATLANPRSGMILAPAPVVQLQYASTGQAYPRSGKTVTATLTVAGGRTLSGASVTTNSAGIATFDALRITGVAGAITLRFTVTGPGTTVDAPVTLRGGVPASMSIATQPSTSAVTGRVFPRPPVIQLLDASGNDSPEADVSVQAAASSGTVAGQIAISDATGRVTFSNLTVTGTSASRTLTFTSPSHTTLNSATSNAFLLTGVETRLQMERTASAFACAAVPTTTPRVQLQDVNGTAVPQAGITVTAAFVTGTPVGATIDAGATAVTDATGLATFSTLKLKGATGGYSLDFTAPSLTKATMATSIAEGAADTLKIQTQPSNTVENGVAMVSSPVVRVYDDCNNLVTTPISINAGVTTGAVTFTNGVRASSSGQATFSNLQMAGRIGTYRLRFTATGVGADTATVQTALTRGAAAKIVVSQEPSTTARSNIDLTIQPKVIVTDVGGNGVTGSRVVSAAVIDGYAQTSGGTTATVGATDSVATFTTLKLVGVAGPNELSFSSSGLTAGSAAQPIVLGGAGTASKITLDTLPSTGVFNNTAFGRPPVIQLRDATDAVVTLAGVTVTAAQANNNPYSLSNNFRTTDANGKVSFNTLFAQGAAQSSGALTFTVAGLTPVTSATATTIVQQLTNNASVFTAGNVGANMYYAIVLPTARTSLTVTITSGSGDADVYVRAGDVPVVGGAGLACSAVTSNSSNETCVVPNPAAGTYFILVKGTGDFSGSLKAAHP